MILVPTSSEHDHSTQQEPAYVLLASFPGSPLKSLGMRLCNYSNIHVCGRAAMTTTQGCLC